MVGVMSVVWEEEMWANMLLRHSPDTVYKINNHLVVFVLLQMKLKRQLAFTYYNKVSNGYKVSFKSLKEYYY